MKKNNTTHAGGPGLRTGVEAERTITKNVESPIILPNELLCAMNEYGLDAYMQSLTDYIVALGGSVEVVDAIFRTSLLVGFNCAEEMMEENDLLDTNKK